MTSPSIVAGRRKAVPAWLLSALLHALLVLLLPLLLTNAVPRGLPSHDRAVGIVLASASEDQQVEYFSAESADEGDASAAAAATPARDAAAALPSAAAASLQVPGGIALPQLDDGPRVGGEGLVQTPQLSVAGRSRLPSGLDPSSILADEAARRQALAARGPSTQLGLFGGTAAEGRRFVFLIDRSKSMGGSGLDALRAAEAELVRAVDALEANHEFQIIAYHHQCTFLQNTRRLLAATSANKEAIRGHVQGLAAFGATDHELALTIALALNPDVIFLLTDGGEPHLSAGDLTRITKLAGGRTSIHCIHFGSGPLQDADNFLRRLAALNDGGYGYVDMTQARK